MPIDAEERLIARPTLHDQVVEQLREMIVEAELIPGDRVDEKSLCAVFGISRTPLREALKVLASDGLVELFPNRSPRVTVLTDRNVREVFEVISWLDRKAGELAAEKVTEKDIRKLKKIHKQMLQHYKQGERTEYFRLNGTLHSSIVKIAANSVLDSLYAGLLTQTQRARYMAIQLHDHWDQGVREHEKIFELLASKDGIALGELLRDHVKQTGQRVVESLEFTKSGPK